MNEVQSMFKLSKKTHSDLIKKWQTNSAFLKAYDELADEFAQVDASKTREKKTTTKQGSLPDAEEFSEATSKANRKI